MNELDAHLGWASADAHGDEVLYAVDGPLGRVRLNRPRAINALDQASVASLLAQLTAWRDDDAVRTVVLDGSGERGLCAGGDVRALREALLAGRGDEAVAFWEMEYAVDGMVATYPKPYVAWMDGIVMGGGVGIASHGSVRLATERTRLAMPETIIGFFPDVGALQLLARASGETGTYAALTGATVGGADAVVLGLADWVVPSGSKEDVLAALREEDLLAALREDRELAGARLAQVAGVPDMAGVLGPGTGDGESWLLAHRSWIDACFSGDDAGAILRRLREREEPAAHETADLIESRSPYAVAMTLEALRRAASMSVEEVLAQDLEVARTFATHPDFLEGVRAQLVDKDRRPRWAHGSVTEVSRKEILAAFGEC